MVWFLLTAMPLESHLLFLDKIFTGPREKSEESISYFTCHSFGGLLISLCRSLPHFFKKLDWITAFMMDFSLTLMVTVYTLCNGCMITLLFIKREWCRAGNIKKNKKCGQISLWPRWFTNMKMYTFRQVFPHSTGCTIGVAVSYCKRAFFHQLEYPVFRSRIAFHQHWHHEWAAFNFRMVFPIPRHHRQFGSAQTSRIVVGFITEMLFVHSWCRYLYALRHTQFIIT